MPPEETINEKVTAIRLAKNELLFKELNENIESSGKKLFQQGEQGNSLDFICECADSDCFRKIPLTISEYNKIRHKKNRFILSPQHQITKIEKVVAKNPQYYTVEKTGTAKIVAENS